MSELPLKEHRNYMLSLYKKGVMKLAGPLTDSAGGAVVLEVSGDPWAPVPWEKLVSRDPS